MSGRIDKEFRPLLKELKALGCDIVDGGKHPKAYLDGRLVYVFPTSSGDRRALLRARSDLRKAGVLT